MDSHAWVRLPLQRAHPGGTPLAALQPWRPSLPFRQPTFVTFTAPPATTQLQSRRLNIKHGASQPGYGRADDTAPRPAPAVEPNGPSFARWYAPVWRHDLLHSSAGRPAGHTHRVAREAHTQPTAPGRAQWPGGRPGSWVRCVCWSPGRAARPSCRLGCAARCPCWR